MLTLILGPWEAPSRTTIGRWVQAAGEAAGRVLSDELEIILLRVARTKARPSGGCCRVAWLFDEEPEAIEHLRAYSDYLSPRLGVLTPDTWTILAMQLTARQTRCHDLTRW